MEADAVASVIEMFPAEIADVLKTHRLWAQVREVNSSFDL
jgi:hypothetical protein